MKSYKYLIVVSSVAFILSFLLGLISGNKLNLVFIRAVFMAVLFAGIAFFSYFLITKFLPEFFENSVETNDSLGAQAPYKVDISIGDDDKNSMENPHIFTDSSPLPDFADVHTAQNQSQKHDPDLVLTSLEQALNTQDLPLESNKQNAGNNPKTQNSSTIQSNTILGIDNLPDLQDFNFAPSGSKETNSTHQDDFGISDFEDTKKSSVLAETDLMAKAIRTILTRDT